VTAGPPGTPPQPWTRPSRRSPSTSSVSGLTLRIDGQLLEEIVFDEPDELHHASWTWTPESEGVYTLMATETNLDGAPGLTAVAVVTVGGGTSPRTVVDGTLAIPWLTSPEPTTTTTLPEGTTTVPAPTRTSTTAPATTSTTRPRPTTTSAPTTSTTAPCTPMTPVLAYPPDGATFNQTQQIELGWIGWIFGVSCFPSGFYAEVTTSPGAAPIQTQHFPDDQATWTIPAGNLACGQTYHWRVFSKRSEGSLTDPSIYRSFELVCVPH
jgi:hypothetical protein